MSNATFLAIAVTGMLALNPAALGSVDLPPADSAPTDPARAEAPARATPVKTGKERLSDKASDEQRIDNCDVPPARRGPKIRPNQCPSAQHQVPTN